MIGRRVSFVLTLIPVVALASGCPAGNAPRAEVRPIPADRVLDFATLYGQNCAGCHGADGEFGPAPPLNDPTFLAIVPDATLRRLVAEGRPGTPMPAFSRERGGPLTDEQAKAIARGIKSRWKPEAPRDAPPGYTVSAGKGDPARGKRLFARACATCHGDEGRGGEGKVGPIHDPAFLALISDQAIRRIIITGRRDLKMPDFAGKAGRPDDFTPLTPADVDDLVSYLSGWRRQDESRREE